MCITDKTESYSPHKEVVKQLSSTVIHKMIINRHFAVVVCFCFLACIYANVTTPGLRTTIEDMIWPLHTIKLRLYYRNYTYTEVSIINATQLLSHMNLTQKTLMHCHGYNNTLDTPFVVDTIYAYLNGFTYNIIGADYRYVTYEAYTTSVLLVNAVGNVLSNAIEKMAWAGMDKDKVVLSGHSLGSQIAGCIGRTISFKISEIMAMDPAGPFFGFPEPTITATDAKCVKCIHSDMGDHGTVVPCGYQDYYPNGGRRIQPGCPLDSTVFSVCSHNMSAIYIQEASIHPDHFPSVKCNSWNDFKVGHCDRNVTIPMGETASCEITGKFFLQTNPQKPYGRGLQGTFYDKSLVPND